MMDSNKIMVVIPTLTGGGAEKVADTLIRTFTLLCPDREIVLVLFGKEPCSNLPPGIRIHCLNVETKTNPLLAIFNFFHLIFLLNSVFRKEGRSSVLSVMDYANLISLLANRLSGIKNRIVASVHTRLSAQTREHAANFRERAIGILVPILYNMADSIIAITDGVRDDLVENFRIDKSRVLVVNNPIDLSQIKKSCNEKIDEPAVHTDNAIVLSVGRLSKEKGIDSLLSAFSTIHDRTDAHLVIIGTGPEENDLLSLANSLGIENKVSFIGYRVNPYSYMSKATILVLASRYEGLPMVVLEAMACGLPVVVTRCFPGVEEIVGDGGAGLIVDTNDESGLAEAIQKLLADSQLRERMALEGRVRAQRFAAETIARQYLKVLDGVEWAYVRNLRKS